MKVKRLFRLAVCAALLAVGAFAGHPAIGQETTPRCEMHIWPASSFVDSFQSVGIGPNGGMGTGVTVTTSSRPKVVALLESYLDAEAQHQAFQGSGTSSLALLQGFTVFFHKRNEFRITSEVAVTGFQNIPRFSNSQSPCYIEILVSMVTLETTTLSKKLQTAFILRDFGGNLVENEFFIGVVSNGAGAFPDEGDQPRLDVRAAFTTNVAEFLDSRRSRRVLRERLQDR